MLPAIPQRWRSLRQVLRHARRIDVLIVAGTGALDNFGTGPVGMPRPSCSVGALMPGCGKQRSASRAPALGADPPLAEPPADEVGSRQRAMPLLRRPRGEAIHGEHRARLRGRPGIPRSRLLVAGPVRVRSATAGAIARDDRRWRHAYHGWRDDPDEQAIHHVCLGKLTEFGVWLIERGYCIRLLTGGTRDGVAVVATRVEAALGPTDQERHRGRSRQVRRRPDEGNRRDIDGRRPLPQHRLRDEALPAISIGFAAKNHVLMEESGLGHFCQHVERFQVDLLIQQFMEFGANQAAYQPAMRDALDNALQRLDEQEDLPSTALRQGAGHRESRDGALPAARPARLQQAQCQDRRQMAGAANRRRRNEKSLRCGKTLGKESFNKMGRPPSRTIKRTTVASRTALAAPTAP